MEDPRVKIADCSCDTLVRIALQCGFSIIEGRKHCKIKTTEGRFVTTIPRHNRLKRETARGIVEALNSFGASISYL
jgi:hypothetical protein